MEMYCQSSSEVSVFVLHSEEIFISYFSYMTSGMVLSGLNQWCSWGTSWMSLARWRGLLKMRKVYLLHVYKKIKLDYLIMLWCIQIRRNSWICFSSIHYMWNHLSASGKVLVVCRYCLVWNFLKDTNFEDWMPTLNVFFPKKLCSAWTQNVNHRLCYTI